MYVCVCMCVYVFCQYTEDLIKFQKDEVVQEALKKVGVCYNTNIVKGKQIVIPAVVYLVLVGSWKSLFYFGPTF